MVMSKIARIFLQKSQICEVRLPEFGKLRESMLGEDVISNFLCEKS
jgi:hypothetical protein